jgi:hypothetical protein
MITENRYGVRCVYNVQKSVKNVSDLSHFTCNPVLHSEPSGVLGTDLVIVSSTENYCPIALITYNHFEIGISSYGPELSFPLWRGYPEACWTSSRS